MQTREESRIGSLTRVLRYHENPFLTESNKLYNIVTNNVLPDNITSEIFQQPAIAKELFHSFCNQRILGELLICGLYLVKEIYLPGKIVPKK